jgi:hypothetical protein
MRRDVFTAHPPDGDYILSSTGYTWDVRRATGNGSGMRIAVGERNRKVALTAMRTLAERDQADAWETSGSDSFRLVTRPRSSP